MAMMALEYIRNISLQRTSWYALQQWVHEQQPEHDPTTTTTTTDDDAARIGTDFITRTIFPFGTHYPRRWCPVTPEYKDTTIQPTTNGIVPTVVTTKSSTTTTSLHRTVNLSNQNPTIPNEIHLPDDVSTTTNHPKKPVPKSIVPTLTKRQSLRVTNNVATQPTTAKPAVKKNHPRTKIDHVDVDDDTTDSGISLDELKCCICCCGDCTDENDLLLCDGANCYRAYHMQCIDPPLIGTMDNEDEDWFCPLCQTQAELLYKIQLEVQRVLYDDDDDWERRRYVRNHTVQNTNQKKVKNCKGNRGITTTHPRHTTTVVHHDDDDDSLKSWEHVNEVFPEAEWEYDIAQQLKQNRGLCNNNIPTNIELLLTRILGQELCCEQQQQQHPTATTELDIDDDEEDNVDDDGNFDLYSYHEERRLEREQRKTIDDSGDDGTSSSMNSSQVTLGEISSLEMQVEDDELAALTDGNDDNNNGESSSVIVSTTIQQDSSKNAVAVSSSASARYPTRHSSRRVRNPTASSQTEKNGNRHDQNGEHGQHDMNNMIMANHDPGKMDTSNIILGKRRRRNIDYRKLNEVIFGNVSETELEKMDDGEDYK
jgi:hypothetical protein